MFAIAFISAKGRIQGWACNTPYTRAIFQSRSDADRWAWDELVQKRGLDPLKLTIRAVAL